MNFTYRELDADLPLVLSYGWSVLELRREVKKLANSTSGNEVVSDKHAAELNRIAGFVKTEFQKARGATPPVVLPVQEPASD